MPVLKREEKQNVDSITSFLKNDRFLPNFGLCLYL